MILPIYKYINQRKIEEQDKRFHNYHQLIDILSQGDKLDKQIAVIYELKKFPNYFSLSKVILENWFIRSDIKSGMRDEIIKTLQYIEWKDKTIFYKIFNYRKKNKEPEIISDPLKALKAKSKSLDKFIPSEELWCFARIKMDNLTQLESYFHNAQNDIAYLNTLLKDLSDKKEINDHSIQDFHDFSIYLLKKGKIGNPDDENMIIHDIVQKNNSILFKLDNEIKRLIDLISAHLDNIRIGK